MGKPEFPSEQLSILSVRVAGLQLWSSTMVFNYGRQLTNLTFIKLTLYLNCGVTLNMNKHSVLQVNRLSTQVQEDRVP